MKRQNGPAYPAGSLPTVLQMETVDGSADDDSRIGVADDRQIEPAFTRSDIGDINVH